MTLQSAYKIVKSVIDRSHDEDVFPVFATEKEVQALELIFDVVESNLDNLLAE